MAGVEGLEPPTLGLEIRCSIRLSYTPAMLYHHTKKFAGWHGGHGALNQPYLATHSRRVDPRKVLPLQSLCAIFSRRAVAAVTDRRFLELVSVA